MENLQAERKIAATVIKMLPRNANDRLKETIGDILHNEVEELYLEDNKISDEGAKALAEALKVNTALQDLNLVSNSKSIAVRQQIRSGRLKVYVQPFES